MYSIHYHLCKSATDVDIIDLSVFTFGLPVYTCVSADIALFDGTFPTDIQQHSAIRKKKFSYNVIILVFPSTCVFVFFPTIVQKFLCFPASSTTSAVL